MSKGLIENQRRNYVIFTWNRIVKILVCKIHKIEEKELIFIFSEIFTYYSILCYKNYNFNTI